jgi:uncharacterized protein YqeY
MDVSCYAKHDLGDRVISLNHMTLHEQIKSQVKEAMLAKDSVKLTTLRGLLSAFTNELVATSRKPQELLRDEEVLTVIKRAVKQRKDSIDQYTSGGRADLADGEKAELAILEVYLPKMMSIDEVKSEVSKIIANNANVKTPDGALDKSKMGMIMSSVMKELKGKADGADVKMVVEGMFR